MHAYIHIHIQVPSHLRTYAGLSPPNLRRRRYRTPISKSHKYTRMYEYIHTCIHIHIHIQVPSSHAMLTLSLFIQPKNHHLIQQADKILTYSGEDTAPLLGKHTNTHVCMNTYIHTYTHTGAIRPRNLLTDVRRRNHTPISKSHKYTHIHTSI
jgi:hypothetical protein